MKYLIDRYNLSYVYGKTEAPTSVHASAVNMFLVGILMQNFLMLFFFVIRGGKNVVSLLLEVITFLFCRAFTDELYIDCGTSHELSHLYWHQLVWAVEKSFFS